MPRPGGSDRRDQQERGHRTVQMARSPSLLRPGGNQSETAGQARQNKDSEDGDSRGPAPGSPQASEGHEHQGSIHDESLVQGKQKAKDVYHPRKRIERG